MKKGILGALPIVAAAYSERFGVRVNVGGDRAYTDGQTVQIPAIEKSYGNMDIVWGYLAHESAHIKWSDFSMSSTTFFEHELVNALEDCRIETAMIQEFPGTAQTLGALDEFLIKEGCHSIPDDTCNPAQIIISTCLYWGMINVVGKTMFDPLMLKTYRVLCDVMGVNFGYQLVSLMQNQLPKARSTQDIRNLVADIIKLMKDESQAPDMLSAASSPQQQGGQQDQQAGASDAGDGSPSKPSQNGEQDGKTGATATDGSADKGNPADHSQGNSQGNDPNTGVPQNEAASAGKCSSNDPSQNGESMTQATVPGSTTQTAMPGGAGQQPESSGTQDALQNYQQQGHLSMKDWAQQALSAGESDLPKDRMQAIRKELEMHEDAGAKYLTVRQAPETAMNEWQGKVLHRAAEKVGTRLQHELMGLVQSRARNAQKARSHGKRLDTSRVLRVMSGDPRVFRTPTERVSPNTAIHLLVDASGSMSREGRLETAQTAAMALAKALDAIKGVNPAVSFFGGITSDPVRYAMRHGQKTITRSGYFAPTAGGSTPMAEAIWYAAYELSKTRERRKMLVVITDGDPNNEPATRSVIELAEQSDMEVVGIGIETMVNAHLFRRHIVINKVEELCNSLFGLMGEYLVADLAA